MITINNQNTLVYPDVFGKLDSEEFKIKKLGCDFIELKFSHCNIVNFNKSLVLLALCEIKSIIFDTYIDNELRYNDFKNNTFDSYNLNERNISEALIWNKYCQNSNYNNTFTIIPLHRINDSQFIFNLPTCLTTEFFSGFTINIC